MASLTRIEATARSGLITVTRMEVDLDLDQGATQFGSHTRIAFSCKRPGQATFVDLRPVACQRVVLNGRALDAAAIVEGRLPLTGLEADNVLEVEATMAYRSDGQGLHRAVDPADGEHYLYGHLFLDVAPQVFACFDQPDLKAPYAVSVTAPSAWTVIGNGAATQVSPGRWKLAETHPLATYFVTVCAGPWATLRDEHDGIPLGLHIRRSLAADLQAQAAQIFEVTKSGFDYFHELFGIRYPFGDYHQVFVPEFNAGAMENPGCVTLRDTHYIPRGAASREQVLERTNTVLHELAHMWFGNLVTMRWWDDLWLNESFAEYMAYRSCVAATEFTNAWVQFSIVRKMWGYASERTPSTHPVAGSPAADAVSALSNFDGISYAKGAAVLRQLVAHIGDEAFVSGVAAYLRGHAFGNGELAEFFAAIETSAGTDLGDWCAAWLGTAGVDRLSVTPDGVVDRVAPQEFPADRVHTTDVAGFTAGVEVFRVPLTVTASTAVVARLRDAPAAAVVVPNASDLTWATVVLDDETLAGLPGELAQVADPMARTVTWGSLLDATYLGRLDPRRVLDVFSPAWPLESDDAILNRVAMQLTQRIVPTFLPDAEQDAARLRIADAAWARLGSAEPRSAVALVAARAFARTSSDVARLRAWAAGDELPDGLEHDTDFRWVVVRTLAGGGHLSADDIDAFRRADETLTGQLAALSARAAIPTPEAKWRAWRTLTTDTSLSNHAALAIASSFWATGELDLLRTWVARYVEDLPAMSAWMGDDALSRVVLAAFPDRIVEQATADAVRTRLAAADLTPGVRRSMVDALSQLGEAIRSQATFAHRVSR